MKLNWVQWIYALLATFIGGGAGAVGAVMGASWVFPGQVGIVGNPGWNALKLMIVTFVINGGIAAFAYLKQSPLPATISEVTRTETVKVTEAPKP